MSRSIGRARYLAPPPVYSIRQRPEYFREFAANHAALSEDTIPLISEDFGESSAWLPIDQFVMASDTVLKSNQLETTKVQHQLKVAASGTVNEVLAEAGAQPA